jgi:hypothetical protein
MKKLISICWLLAAGSVHAAPVIVDFEALYWSGEGSNSSNVSHGNVYTEDGFKVTDLDGQYELSTWAADTRGFTGSTAMFNNSREANTELRQVGGGAFDLVSIDLAALHPGINDVPMHDPSTFVSVTFVANTGHSQTFDVGYGSDGPWIYDDFWEAYFAEGPPPVTTFNFDSGFIGVTSVAWLQNDGSSHQFDNIMITNAVPIPAAFWLFASGLAFIGWKKRSMSR